MYLNRKDIEKIYELMTKFPEVQTFELKQERCSGIGAVTTLEFEQVVRGNTGSFKIEISGVEDW